ncbi:MAG: sigma-54-dependent Fis family transcriptional regulator [Deltaproteobacteria bacterium]|nr:sigma-54-dependent Fis family transcriptional regulator [Deltaproteobacteria bacterium]
MSEEKIQVLVADDERNLRRMLKAQLERWGYEVHLAETGTEAMKTLGENHIDIVITDLRMPEMDGMELLSAIQKENNGLPVIMITAHGTVDTAVEAIKLGAFDYITKPYDRNALKDVVAKAAKTCELAKKEIRVDTRQDGRFKIIGKSARMMEIYEMVDRVAPTPSTVLISGESGTGKELIARALFDNSKREKMPFIRVNCAAIPPTLIESELFGYEKGAFTGAETSKPGRFELANGGTLFLDEVGEISIEMQVKLLRAIQEGEFERVGGVSTIKVDVRLITATNQDLRQMVKDGRFRDDLFYRLNVVHIPLPRLADRKEDIPLLAMHFLTKYNARLGKNIGDFSSEALDALLRYEWPGNIRELENVVERCTLFCDDELIAVSHLPSDVSGESERSSSPDISLATADLDIENGGLKDQVRAATANLEKQLIIKALEQTDKNVTRAAQLLKISRKSLQTKMKDFGLRDDM